jgi:amino acid permease
VSSVQGLDLARVPAFGESYAGMLGSIMFNYGFVVMVPSWLNEKKPSVSVNKTLWTSTVVSTILYILIGVLGGLAYEDIDGNFLNTLSSHCNPLLTRLTAFSFAVICVGLSVPVSSAACKFFLASNSAFLECANELTPVCVGVCNYAALQSNRW